MGRAKAAIVAFSSRINDVDWSPNFKISNVDKFETKMDPRDWIAIYTTAARAANASEDLMTAYVPIKLGHDALQWLRHLRRGAIEDWSDFCQLFISNFQSL